MKCELSFCSSPVASESGQDLGIGSFFPWSATPCSAPPRSDPTDLPSPVLSCVLLYIVLPYFTSPNLVFFIQLLCIALNTTISLHPVLPCPVYPCPVLRCPSSPCPALHFSILPSFALIYPAEPLLHQSCPVLVPPPSFPLYPAMTHQPNPVLPCPVL